MPIRPTSVNPDRTVSVVHEETGHAGAIPFARVEFGRRPDGSVDFRYATLRCPQAGCDAASTYPIGGGSLPETVQRIFVAALLAAPTSIVPNPPATLAEAKARVRALVAAMDGPGRWRLEGLTAADLLPAPVAPVVPNVTRRGGGG